MLIKSIPIQLIYWFIGLGIFNFLVLLLVAITKKQSLENMKNKLKNFTYYVVAWLVMTTAMIFVACQSMSNSFSMSFSQYSAILSVVFKLHFIAAIVLFKFICLVINILPMIIASVVNGCKTIHKDLIQFMQNFETKNQYGFAFDYVSSRVRLNL